MDPAKLAVREKGPKWAFFVALINLSKTCLDKNKPKTPTERGKRKKQKRHFNRSALKNGRSVGSDCGRILERVQRIPCLSGNLQAKPGNLRLSFGFWRKCDISSFFTEMVAETLQIPYL